MVNDMVNVLRMFLDFDKSIGDNGNGNGNGNGKVLKHDNDREFKEFIDEYNNVIKITKGRGK